MPDYVHDLDDQVPSTHFLRHFDHIPPNETTFAVVILTATRDNRDTNPLSDTSVNRRDRAEV